MSLSFGSTALPTATTNSSGVFALTFTVPTAAPPGLYVISATGQTSGRTASAPFRVNADWPMFHADLAHTGVNPYEDMLGASNVSSLGLAWRYPTGDQIFRSSPAVANGVVYIGSFDHTLYALNASTGALLWSYTTGSFIRSSPAVANGVVYVGSEDGTLYALNATSGALLWSYSPAGGAAIDSSPAVAGGMVYVGSEDHNLYVFSLP